MAKRDGKPNREIPTQIQKMYKNLPKQVFMVNIEIGSCFDAVQSLSSLCSLSGVNCSLSIPLSLDSTELAEVSEGTLFQRFGNLALEQGKQTRGFVRFVEQ